MRQTIKEKSIEGRITIGEINTNYTVVNLNQAFGGEPVLRRDFLRFQTNITITPNQGNTTKITYWGPLEATMQGHAVEYTERILGRRITRQTIKDLDTGVTYRANLEQED